ncbi:hypothetical protein VSR68_30650 [Paraburkholderia phymatum]|uniref:hypothetical protein n=1 Tax=Paraburkholderia phymatum TaxID=148447 RepID=UPI00316F8C6A
MDTPDAGQRVVRTSWRVCSTSVNIRVITRCSSVQRLTKETILKNEQAHLTEFQQMHHEMMKLLREVNQRNTRTESRMVQLGDYVGANLRTRMRIDMKRAAAGVCVEIDALDVSISRIVGKLRDEGINEAMDVYLNNRRVATVYP